MALNNNILSIIQQKQSRLGILKTEQRKLLE